MLALLQGLVMDCESSALRIPGLIIAMNIFNQSEYMEPVLDPLSAPRDNFLVLNFPFDNSQKLQNIGRIKAEISFKRLCTRFNAISRPIRFGCLF